MADTDPCVPGSPSPTDAQQVKPHAYLDVCEGKTRPVFVHPCSFTGTVRQVVLDGRWAISQAENGELSLSPSLHCTACGTHGFWTAGEWKCLLTLSR